MGTSWVSNIIRRSRSSNKVNRPKELTIRKMKVIFIVVYAVLSKSMNLMIVIAIIIEAKQSVIKAIFKLLFCLSKNHLLEHVGDIGKVKKKQKVKG